jgi:hypothetical protein
MDFKCVQELNEIIFSRHHSLLGSEGHASANGLESTPLRLSTKA